MHKYFFTIMGKFKEKFIETYSEASYGPPALVSAQELSLKMNGIFLPAWMCSCKIYDDGP